MPWTADGKWVPEDDSVATRLTGLLAPGSKYIQTARAAGQRTAGRRGLLNSSIAAGAGESAAIAAAAPIASQDASQTFQRNQAVLEGGISLSNQTQLNQQQLTGQKELNAQQNAAQVELQRMQNDAAEARLRLEQEGATAAQLREFDQRTAEQTRGLESEAARQAAQLTSQERQAALAADTNILQTQISANSQLSSQYLQAFSQLASNPEIPADVRNKYIAEFKRVMEQGQSLINVIQQTPLSWGPGATAQTPAPTPAPTPPPAPAPAAAAPPPAPAPAPAPAAAPPATTPAPQQQFTRDELAALNQARLPSIRRGLLLPEQYRRASVA